jgi:hypothetical protein
MATIRTRAKKPPTTIDQFLGINEDTSGDTQLQLGESPNMVNYRLTENYKLRKREGYTQLFASLGLYEIRGMWEGKLNGTNYLLFAANGNLYSHDLGTGANTSLGALTDAKTFFFSFDSKVYMLNGSEYKYYDGTTFGDVAGYIPLIATATPPAGGGSANEQINQLTGKKRQTFSADGTETVYQVAETSLASVDVVKVNGVTKTAGTDYTVDLATGKVTFSAAPAQGVDNVDIQWTKNNHDRTTVTENLFAMFFGGKNDTRVFFYGDGTNEYYFTGLANGVPSAEYVPVNNYRKISSSEFQITDIERQHDRQIIYTDGGETWYSYYDPITDVDGNVIPDFPTFPLNDSIGNIAIGQAQLIQNNPFSIQNGVYEWIATEVRDERNAMYKSKRVQPSLDEEDLTKAITVDWEARREYWLAIENRIWIYNYRLDAWYRFETADNITCFLVKGKDMYIGTPNGQIMKFDRDVRTDNGVVVTGKWEMNFYDFNAEWLRKFLTEMWIALKPELKSGVDITYQTDRDGSSDTYTATYKLATFTNADFADWSFSTSYNPQPFRFKIKAKKFVYFKLILTNDSDKEKLTVLSINLPVRFGSKVK